MSLLCRWRQHHFAQDIIAGETVSSALSQHLAQCAACHHAYSRMQRLHQELAQSILFPAASEGFTDAVRAKILARTQTPQRSNLPKTALALSGAAVLLLCVILLRSENWRTKPEISVMPAVVAPKPEKPHPTQNFALVFPSKKTVRLTGTAEKSPLVPHRNRLRTVRRSRIAFAPPHRSRRTVAFHEKPKRLAALAPLLSPEIRSQQWAQWANVCENRGDFSRAADAYAHAYNTLPTEGTAFSAGQAAENAGDVSQAVLYYSQILRQPLKQKPQTEKGTFRWNSERDAA